LNFRDVLVALDLYPERVDVFGQECSGVVARVGPGVEHLAAGDRVLAFAVGSLATHVTVAAALAVPIDPGTPFTEAASLPVAFLTAMHALEQVAQLRAGERVLIHAAAGGVGLAAVQVATRIGAEVLATAGTPDKRALLAGMGVRHVFDSRSLDFAPAVLDATGQQGVDVVLNSLAGDFIGASLDVLGNGGRFVELGRRDIWTPEQMAGARPDVDYTIVFLGDLVRDDVQLVHDMLGDVVAGLAAGRLVPSPVTAFPATDVAEAFRYMAGARHVGKVVVTMPVADPVPVRADGTYVVTGGLGGIGRHVARHLIAGGARHLVLLGRTPEPDARALDELRRLGATVTYRRADVAVRGDVEAALHAADLPLWGVVHAAGEHDDAVLAAMDREQVEAVLRTKLAGSWHLHELTRDLPLDFVVWCSSVAAVLGNAGQANYAAANAFVDAVASLPRHPATRSVSIGWGPWQRVGMTDRLTDTDWARLARRGLLPMTPDQALTCFDRALAGPDHHVLAATFGATDAGAGAAATVEPAAADWLQQLAATPASLRRTTASSLVRDLAGHVLGLAATADMAPRQPLNELGLDSLLAVELRNGLGQALGRRLPVTLLFDHPTLEALTDVVLGLLPDAGPATATAEAEASAALVAELAALDEDEAEALLLAELGGDATS
jgi:NADPH:quinone reductase-like Zn-dependent oxidoreductase